MRYTVLIIRANVFCDLLTLYVGYTLVLSVQ